MKCVCVCVYIKCDKVWGWRDGSAVNSTSCSLQRTWGWVQSLHVVTYTDSNSSSIGSGTLFWILWAPGMSAVHIHIGEQKFSETCLKREKHSSAVECLPGTHRP